LPGRAGREEEMKDQKPIIGGEIPTLYFPEVARAAAANLNKWESGGWTCRVIPAGIPAYRHVGVFRPDGRLWRLL
jgi:hypothetical protein